MSSFSKKIMNNISIDEDFLKLNSDNFGKIFNKKSCYIFGKNGSGKTTISRKISNTLNDKYDLFIFNKDYIKNNVFIQDEKKEDVDAQKISVKNKSRTFDIFLGKTLVDITKKISKNEENKISNQENLKNSFLIETELKDWLSFLNYEKKIYEKKDFKKPIIREEILAGIKNKNPRSEIFNDIRNKISSIKLIKEREVISSDFNNLIKTLKIQNSSFDKFNLHWRKTSKLQKVIDLHKNALELSKPEGYIEFLGKKIEQSDIIKYLEDNTSEKNEILADINDRKKTIKKEFKKILHNIESKNLNKNYIEMKKNIEEISKNNILEIKDNEEFSFRFELYKKHKEDKKSEIDNIKKIINENWVILIMWNYNPETISNISEYLNTYKILKEETKLLREEKERLGGNFNKSFVKKINKTIKYISKDDFGIELKNSSRTGEHFLEIRSNNKNIEHLSEGEKNTLAISYFLVDLAINYENINKDFIVFIDDPFDSNDHFKYDYLFDLKFDIDEKELNIIHLLMKIEEYKNVESRFIVSTHNINVLSAFIRNLKNTKGATGKELFYKMNNKEDINLVHLVKKPDNNIEIIDLDINLFFPKEDLMRKYIDFDLNINLFFQKEDLMGEYIDVDLDTKAKNPDFQIYLLISTLRIKLLDNYEYSDKKEVNKKRGKIKEFVIKHKNIANFDFTHESILKFLEENFSTKMEIDLIEDFVKYLLFIKDRYEEILKSDDEAAFKRLRHKNNFYSMPIGHIIEE